MKWVLCNLVMDGTCCSWSLIKKLVQTGTIYYVEPDYLLHYIPPSFQHYILEAILAHSCVTEFHHSKMS